MVMPHTQCEVAKELDTGGPLPAISNVQMGTVKR